MTKFFRELKEFAIKGNVIDLAVGVIIGGAFGKVVSSLVSDILMPPIGMLIGGINFTDIVWHLSPLVTINIGNFIQATLDLFIISAAVFGLIKIMNRLRRNQEEDKIVTELMLLTEIRDLLKNKNTL